MLTGGELRRTDGSFNEIKVRQIAEDLIWREHPLTQIKETVVWEKGSVDDLAKQIVADNDADQSKEAIAYLIRMWAMGEDLPPGYGIGGNECEDWWLTAREKCSKDGYLGGFFPPDSAEAGQHAIEQGAKLILEAEIREVLERIWDLSERKGLIGAEEQSGWVNASFTEVFNQVFHKTPAT